MNPRIKVGKKYKLYVGFGRDFPLVEIVEYNEEGIVKCKYLSGSTEQMVIDAINRQYVSTQNLIVYEGETY